MESVKRSGAIVKLELFFPLPPGTQRSFGENSALLVFSVASCCRGLIVLERGFAGYSHARSG